MATSGFIKHLRIQGNQKGINDWLERFETTASLQPGLIVETDANKYESKKKKYLIGTLGPESYSLLKATIAPTTMTEASFKTLKDNLKSLAPRPSVISESFKLNTVTQSPDEELAVYMGRVKLTAQNCDYGDAFDRIVRDKFICGLQDQRGRSVTVRLKR